MPTLEDAIQNIRMGNREEGRALLEEMLDEDENNEQVWLWLSTVVDSDADREICLENVLALDPENAIARESVEAIQAGDFEVNDLLQVLLEEQGGLDEEEPSTFLDDFYATDDDDFDDLDDDDLLMPGEKAGKPKKRGLNVRMVILGVLVVVLIIVLGSLAAASIFLLGDDSGGEVTQPEGTPPAQEAPAEEAAPTATPVDTPTPAPTDTPTATPTSSLQLPTPRPTDEPTPTATRVVSPTPIGN